MADYTMSDIRDLINDAGDDLYRAADKLDEALTVVTDLMDEAQNTMDDLNDRDLYDSPEFKEADERYDALDSFRDDIEDAKRDAEDVQWTCEELTGVSDGLEDKFSI